MQNRARRPSMRSTRSRSRSVPSNRSIVRPSRNQPQAALSRSLRQQDVITDITATITILIKDPIFMLLVALSAALVIMHAGDIDDGPLAPLFPKDSTNAFVIWVRKNVPKLFGMITFAPVLYETPTRYRFMALIAVPIWIYIAPACKQEQYAVQALLYYLFMKVKLDITRITLVVASVCLYFLGLLFDPRVPPINPTNPPIPTVPVYVRPI